MFPLLPLPSVKKCITLLILLILAWIIFIWVGIEACGFISNTLFTMLKPESAKYLWQQVDLSDLYKYDNGHFLVIMILISIVAVLKTLLFYQIVKILHAKKLSLSQPFNIEMQRFISMVSYLALGIGLFCWRGAEYTKWLVEKGAKMPDIQTLRFGGADVWLFMGVTLFIIAQMFKRGIEIQSENDLTI